MIRNCFKLIVFSIVALMGLICAYVINMCVEQAKRGKARTQCINIIGNLNYKIQSGEISNQTGVRRYLGELESDRGLFRTNSKGELVDPWKHPLIVKVHFDTNIALEIGSAARDGIYGTLDDIVYTNIIGARVSLSK